MIGKGIEGIFSNAWCAVPMVWCAKFQVPHAINEIKICRIEEGELLVP